MKAEFVLVCGYPAAGKTTLVKEFTDAGYYRINRDLSGGTLEEQSKLAEDFYKKGNNKIVLDNTYITIESREGIIAVAKKLNVPIRCVWLNTSFEDSQLNACLRMIKKTGVILSPQELKDCKDPNLFPPVVLYNAKNKLEGKDKNLKYPGKQNPKTSEGFYKVEIRQFVRHWDAEYKNKALILDFDDTIRTSIGPKPWPEKPEHVKILDGRTETLNKWKQKGYILLGASNQSAVAKGLSIEDCTACFEKTIELLNVKIDYVFCPHKVPPVSCYCRKPGTGMTAYFIVKYKLNPSECIFVGDSTSDKTCAERSGMKYMCPTDFFNKHNNG